MTAEEKGADVTVPEGAGTVVLPCPPDQFARFIGGLLGKPQVIQRGLRGSFDIGFEEINSLYHLIDHRLHEQNKGQLTQFSITFSFDDQSSVTVNGYDEFSRYAEVKNVETLRVTCSFEYLIQFNGRKHPEKQTIDVTFIRGNLGGSWDEDEDLFPLALANGFHRSGTIFLRIRHTARSWGADMESLLSEHLKGLMRKEGVWQKRFRKRRDAIALLFSVFGFIGGLVTTGLAITLFESSYYTDIPGVLKKIHDATTAAHVGIPYLIQHSGHPSMQGLVLPLAAFCIALAISFAVVIFTFISENLGRPFPSFITFTKADRERKPNIVRRHSRSTNIALGTAAVSVFYGFVGNYIFYIVGTWLGWLA